MKKLASLMGAGAMLLGMAVPAFAGTFSFPWPTPKTTEATVKNYAHVGTTLNTTVNSGWNKTMGWFGSVTSGAASALESVTNQVNFNQIGCNCSDDLYIKNMAGVKATLNTNVNSGFNSSFGGMVTSGAAGVMSAVENVVNTNIVGEMSVN